MKQNFHPREKWTMKSCEMVFIMYMWAVNVWASITCSLEPRTPPSLLISCKFLDCTPTMLAYDFSILEYGGV